MTTSIIVRVNDIIDQIISYNPDADIDLIRKAYVFSAKAHQGQVRLSGEPYLNHPLGVAKILADLSLDEYTVATGLLHDTIEDTIATVDEIRTLFGKEVAFLVDGVTKISKLPSQSREDQQAENFRKMILAMSSDIRVILIKLADRMNNMRTLQYVPAERQQRIAEETLSIYAPLANRLGLFQMKRELEDLSLRYLHPAAYQEIERNLVVTAEQRDRYVQEVIGIIQEKLNQFGIQAVVTGRPKHMYSIYTKMLKQNLNFNQIYDLTAFRIIVQTRQECYEVLGIIHSLWKPIPGRFKDYISLPKANMYQSLHTTVVGPYGQRIEIQIRTEEMDRIAKIGIAAHWKYKEGRHIEQKSDYRFAWLQQIIESQAEVKDSHQLLEAFKVDVFPDEVYVFTPAGDVIELPKGSTPIDFAYRIHTDIGHRCIGAKINGTMVPLRYELQSGDVVEILTQAHHGPSRDWLKFVKTTRAKTKIRQWINQQERERGIALGKEICEKEFKKYRISIALLQKDQDLFKHYAVENIRTLDDLYAAVGQGRISVRQLVHRYRVPTRQEGGISRPSLEPPITQRGEGREKQDTGISIDGLDNILVRYGKCCNPIYGDRIKGFITRGRGVTVHTADCPFLTYADQERIIDAQWDGRSRHVATVPLEVICEDKKGILATITTVIAAAEINIANATVRTTPDKKAVNVFMVDVTSLEQLEAVIAAIKNVKGVLKVTRLHN
ncbi:MAG: bifunctional (p)ppGpp synthetase/guanosine-3',5'-bis(diphosphate) 3'-pyrophosphohydrolase [Desulfobacterota bacterium]|nr:bifunctional (p)ppGpp synthetase/guanosine-3',5'-bis(diphosphate) 3'-pyrophosphohydrolase [Thermodesulfobacteriota bacterium]